MVTPIRGMKWQHAKRVTRDGEPRQYEVTTIRQGIVYSRDVTDRYSDFRIRTTVGSFDTMCAKVIAMPEPKPRRTSVKLSEAQCADLYARAHKAGMAAGETAYPVPMHVVERANPLDDSSPVVRDWGIYADGVCGFAWVNVKPATGSFVNWLRKRGTGYKSYYGGWDISCHEFRQSMQRKEAYAHAFAEILREAGISAHARSRMD